MRPSLATIYRSENRRRRRYVSRAVAWILLPILTLILVISVTMAQDEQVTVPPEFITNDQVDKFEVLAIGANADGERGNRTISENFPCTAPTATIDCAQPE